MSHRSVSLASYSMARPEAPAPLARNGKVDRAVLMRRAVAVARTLRAGGASWSWRMGVALRTVWGWAKREAEQGASVMQVPAPVTIGKSDNAPRARRSGRGWYDRGSHRATTHSW